MSSTDLQNINQTRTLLISTPTRQQRRQERATLDGGTPFSVAAPPHRGAGVERMAGPGFLVSSLIRRQHGGALFLRYLSRLHPAAPLPLGSIYRATSPRTKCDEGEGDSFDFDEIEELRLRKKLFYKLDMGSMEIEECSISLFRRQKSKSKKKKLPEDLAPSREKQVSRKRELSKPSQIPTFSQLTDPYHLPFCLDLFISKGSVRACIIHRATSKVVSVAHSISKDMKFDLTSRRDAAACAAVGTALAQRALSDDIHNVVYSPRKGRKSKGSSRFCCSRLWTAGLTSKSRSSRGSL
ncbi:unnamed protein product [Spirodela intermedia]|uniref:Uncharacterized protein n=1 Tax=Spirodela intermedia TaxID=51605 RepID=A0A7I8I8P8_SPIIN|nr:unnamed protein product [Spirodela intermedia]CAA6653793.1 unnamed protein product [Spirodela intermedia]